MLLLEHLKQPDNHSQLITAEIIRLKKQTKTQTQNSHFWRGYISAYTNLSSSYPEREQNQLTSALQTAMDILEMKAMKPENLYELVVCSLYEEIRKIKVEDSCGLDVMRISESLQDYMIKLSADNQYLQKMFMSGQDRQVEQKQIKQEIIMLETSLSSRFKERLLNPENCSMQQSMKSQMKVQPVEKQINFMQMRNFGLEPTYLTSKILKTQFGSEKKEERRNYWGDLVSYMYSTARQFSQKFHKIQQPEKKQEEIAHFECTICLQKVTPVNICKVTCGHSLHKNCFIDHFKQCVNSKRMPIPCPQQDCEKAVQIDDFLPHIPQDLMDKYYEFSLHKYVEQNGDNTSWCPTPGCSAIFQFEKGIDIYKCPSCSKSYCIKCKNETHQGQCQQLLDHEFVKYTKESQMRQCARCKFWVEKNKGCDHITCRCGYQFCFRCGTEDVACGCDQNPSFYGNDDDDQDEEYEDQDEEENYVNENNEDDDEDYLDEDYLNDINSEQKLDLDFQLKMGEQILDRFKLNQLVQEQKQQQKSQLNEPQ